MNENLQKGTNARKKGYLWRKCYVPLTAMCMVMATNVVVVVKLYHMLTRWIELVCMPIRVFLLRLNVYKNHHWRRTQKLRAWANIAQQLICILFYVWKFWCSLGSKLFNWWCLINPPTSPFHNSSILLIPIVTQHGHLRTFHIHDQF